jgi:hypothetical protein
LDGLRRAAGIDGQHGSSDVFRIVPEQEFDGVRNVLDTRQSLQSAALHNLPSLPVVQLPGHVGPGHDLGLLLARQVGRPDNKATRYSISNCGQAWFEIMVNAGIRQPEFWMKDFSSMNRRISNAQS